MSSTHLLISLILALVGSAILLYLLWAILGPGLGLIKSGNKLSGEQSKGSLKNSISSGRTNIQISKVEKLLQSGKTKEAIKKLRSALKLDGDKAHFQLILSKSLQISEEIGSFTPNLSLIHI